MSLLKRLMVQEAMRRQVIADLPEHGSLGHRPFSYTIKYKVNAIWITAENQDRLGVVSKTDLY